VGYPLTELEAIKTTTERYRNDGYTVAVQPFADLGPYLEIADVDLIATKGDEILAIEMKRQDDQGVKPVIIASGRIDEDYSLSLLHEAERLLMPETRRAALLMAWTAFEAAAREVLQGEIDNQKTERRSPTTLIQELAKRDLIDSLEAEKLRRGMYLRNLTVHGVQPTDVTPETITFLLGIVRHLKHERIIETILFQGTGIITIHKELAQNQEIRKRVMVAVSLLDEILGLAREEVSANWTLGEDGQGQPVIILKLSDLTGAVSGSFELDELEKPLRLKTRLYKIWGDLLGIRIARQMEKLNGPKGAA